MARGDGSKTWIFVALFAAGFAGLGHWIMTGEILPPAVQQILPSILTTLTNQRSSTPGAGDEHPAAAPAKPPAAPRRGPSSKTESVGPDGSRAAAPPPASGPGRRDVGGGPIGAAGRAVEPPPPQPNGRYIPGRTSSWISLGVTATEPLSIRSAGTIWTAEDNAGPDGVARSNYEQQLVKRRATAETDQRVLPSAPYLALIGRVCSTESCSDPFVIGNARTICPPETRKTGVLQLWTNNYRLVDGSQTLQRFSAASGGFWLYTDAAPAGACGAGGAGGPAASAADAAVLASGQVLKKPDFVISSRQTDWKPFFLPLNEPIQLRASGETEPVGGAEPTGPSGRVVPSTGRWTYPGTPAVFVDAENKLFDPSLPYLGLIGRLCRGAECRRPFLVGAEHVVCTAGDPADRLELWINHIRHPPGAMATMLPLTMETLDLQARRGEVPVRRLARAGQRLRKLTSPSQGQDQGCTHPYRSPAQLIRPEKRRRSCVPTSTPS